jgi:hypothetical protein
MQKRKYGFWVSTFLLITIVPNAFFTFDQWLIIFAILSLDFFLLAFRSNVAVPAD